MNPDDSHIADSPDAEERPMPVPAKPSKPYDAREHDSFYP